MKLHGYDAAKRGELSAPNDSDVLFTDFQPTVHDMFVCAALAGILAHPTSYRDICLQAECDQTIPGRIALERAFQWADEAMTERKRRAEAAKGGA